MDFQYRHEAPPYAHGLLSPDQTLNTDMIRSGLDMEIVVAGYNPCHLPDITDPMWFSDVALEMSNNGIDDVDLLSTSFMGYRYPSPPECAPLEPLADAQPTLDGLQHDKALEDSPVLLPWHADQDDADASTCGLCGRHLRRTRYPRWDYRRYIHLHYTHHIEPEPIPYDPAAHLNTPRSIMRTRGDAKCEWLHEIAPRDNCTSALH
ncbi:hypothetical protein T440DRAFT_464062 [Plenodomus tracheiphilus IPT5]|uniref:Uncharacterized protein n=1 Tax=Plenodomus tracheiphilus IPT5 TaxID=1408161 RepID=A0A6A7BLI9_9PLEO|nr:hypothetical protein T440DRAFT_464062 [Plenodomus tracheiphilus IPT5]